MVKLAHIGRLGAGLALAVTLGAAQSPPPSASRDAGGPIVVTGQRLSPEEARARAIAFVERIGVARGEQQAARWIDPVCPRVSGLADRYAAIVVARMRAIAARTGVPVAAEGCSANIAVSFVGDASALMQAIDRRWPARLQDMGRSERHALVHGNAPIRWWYLKDARSRDGMRSTSQTLQTEGAGPGSVPIFVEAVSHYDSSMISTQSNQTLIAANVVIDLGLVEGRLLDSIADYAAFVAFAEVRPSAPPPTGSVLGLFGGEQNSGGLTEWDTAFLRALYALPLDRPARRHRGMLVRDMVNFQTRG